MLRSRSMRLPGPRAMVAPTAIWMVNRPRKSLASRKRRETERSTQAMAIGRSEASSEEAAVGGPAVELVAVGQLQLAQHGRHVGLDGLHAEHELAGDLLVACSPGR